MPRKTIGLVVLLILIFMMLMAILPGCGGSQNEQKDETGEETATVDDTSSGKDEEVADAPNEDTADSATDAVDEEPSFSLDPQQIGSREPLNYLKLVDIRWEDHGDHFRVVAELKRGDWQDIDDVPWCFTDYPESPEEVQTWEDIQLYINGIRAEDVDVASQPPGEGVLTGDPVVYQVLLSTTYTVDGIPSISIFCSTHGQRMHHLSYQTDPMRIILDIQK